jgi:hypothetical protein
MAVAVALAVALTGCTAAAPTDAPTSGTASSTPGSTAGPATSGLLPPTPGGTPGAPALADTGTEVTVSQTAALLTGAGQTLQLTAHATNADGEPLTVEWGSSDPTQVAVDPDGTVTSLVPLGSALVFAVAGDEQAAVTVLVAEPAPGALLVGDDQVAAPPEPLEPLDGIPANGTRFRVTLTGVAPPAAGTIILASGAAEVAGRVVTASAADGRTTVEYELVPLPELLARYAIDLDVPLDPRDATGGTEAEGAVAEGAGVTRAVTQALALPGGDGGVRLAKELEAKKEAKFTKGPLECKASVSAKFKSTEFDIKATTNLSLQVEGRKEIADASTPEHTKVVLSGPLALDVFGGLRAEAGFEGKVECELKKHIPIPLGGILAVVLAITVPIGLSAGAEGKITAVNVELGPKGHLGTTVTIGFECDTNACRAITDQVPDANNGISFETKLDILRNMRVEAGVALNVVTGLGARFGDDYSLIDAKFGPVQSLNLAFDDDQVRDSAYASGYDLKLAGSVTPGDDLKSAISRIFGGEVTLDLSAKYTPEQPLAESPKGTLAADKARVQVDKPVELTVDLKPVDYFLIGPNVAEVRIARWKDGVLHPLTAIPVSASNQTRFEWTWTPSEDFVGMNELVAFVVTNGVPRAPLEIAPDSTTYVEVVDACLPEGTPPPPPAPGSSAGAPPIPGAPAATPPPVVCDADVTITYDSTSHLHEAHWVVSGSLERYVEGMPLEADQPVDDFVGTGTFSGRAVDGLTMSLTYIRPPRCERDQLWVSDEGEVWLTGTLVEEGWPGIDGPAMLVAAFPKEDDDMLVWGLGAAAPLGGGSEENYYLRMAEAECGDEWSEVTRITLAPGVADP